MSYIKAQSEVRDHEIWQASLRQTTAEEYLRMFVAAKDKKQGTATAREIDSSVDVKKILRTLDNADMRLPSLILEQQAHLVNFKMQRIRHMVGIREVVLKRNKLGDKFAFALQKALTYDRYMKVINVAGNLISQVGLKTIVKLALLENNSVVAFDARLNPGSTDKVQRQLALCMLKNIEKMKLKNIAIRDEWIRWELVSVGVPPTILRNLGLRNPAEKPRSPKSQS